MHDGDDVVIIDILNTLDVVNVSDIIDFIDPPYVPGRGILTLYFCISSTCGKISKQTLKKIMY